MALLEDLEKLEQDFMSTPDREKDFTSLQDRFDVLLKQVYLLSKEEKKPLIPALTRFKGYLSEHILSIQKEALEIQELLENKKAQKQAILAYSKAKG